MRKLFKNKSNEDKKRSQLNSEEKINQTTEEKLPKGKLAMNKEELNRDDLNEL